jgi:hypothetical protein
MVTTLTEDLARSKPVMELDAMPYFNKFLQNSTQKFTFILQGTMARDYNSVYVVWFDRPIG